MNSLKIALLFPLLTFYSFSQQDSPESDSESEEESAAEDIVYSSLFTGVHGNYLKPSIENAGMDPDNLPDADKSSMNFGSGGNTKSKAWKDIWGSGQGIGRIKDSPSTAELVDRLKEEFNDAKKEFIKKSE